MTIIHVMIDAETWGKKPGCDIRSIGACVFDPLNGVTFRNETNAHGWIEPFYIACDNPGSDRFNCATSPFLDSDVWRKYPLTRDPETIQWWSEQGADAQAAFANPVDLRKALDDFTYWLIRLSADRDQPGVTKLAMATNERIKLDDIRLWSHGPAFDPPIIAAAFDAVGLPVPWHYRAPRDTRTCFDMAGIDDHSAWLQRFPYGIPHQSRDDAISQAMAVCGAYERVINAFYTHNNEHGLDYRLK